MRAPVYRSVDVGSTFLGLAFPVEVLAILSVFWAAAVTLPPGAGLLLTLVAYALLRFSTAGKPSMHLQHLLLFQVRRGRHAARFSPAARAASSRVFPFAPRRFRERAAASRPALPELPRPASPSASPVNAQASQPEDGATAPVTAQRESTSEWPTPLRATRPPVGRP